MTLASGAHVSINGEEFLLAEDLEGHYVHTLDDLMPPQTDSEITGSPGNKSVRADSLLWTYDDWAGGEGNRNYYGEDWDIYNVAYELNPRIRGQISGRPNRYRIEATCTDVRERPYFTAGVSGKLWMSGGIDLFYSTDPTSSFTLLNDTNDTKLATVSANYRITSLTADDKWCYFSAWHSGASGSRLTRAADASGNDATVQAEATGTSVTPYIGMTVFNGKLYCWDGRKLYEMDIDGLTSGGTGLAADKIRKVYDTGAVVAAGGGSFQSSYWGGCFSTDTSVVMWYSTEMQTRVYEYKKGIGRPIWTVPYGFTVKSGSFSNGVAMFVGHYDADGGTAGYGAIWALPMDSYKPIFVKYVRRSIGGGTAMNLQALNASYGMQFTFAALQTGRLYLYDMETDALTMLDHLSRASGSDPDNLKFVTGGTHRVGDSITYGRYRVFAVYGPGLAGAGTEEYQIVSYDDDEIGNIETGMNSTNYTGYTGVWESPRWHFGYPMEKKQLVGFTISFDPLVSGQTLTVRYKADDGSWTDAEAVTSATAGTSDGRYFIKLGNVTFNHLAMRVHFQSSTGVVVPTLYSITAQARLMRKRETWKLLIRTKDQSAGTRPKAAQRSGGAIRDEILGSGTIPQFVRQSQSVTFLDGYRYKQNDTYLTHNVMVKHIRDVVQQPGEGVMEVELVGVPASGVET